MKYLLACTFAPDTIHYHSTGTTRLLGSPYQGETSFLFIESIFNNAPITNVQEMLNVQLSFILLKQYIFHNIINKFKLMICICMFKKQSSYLIPHM